MLVLTRKIGKGSEELRRIDVTNKDTQETISFEVLTFDRGNVRVGVSAPNNYKITRPELKKKGDVP